MSKEEHPDRPLSELGRQHAQWTADLAAKLGVHVKEIRHSGKTRAKETAEIMAQALSPAQGVLAGSGLGPLDDVEPVAEEIDRASQALLLVGHLPFMERLAGWVLSGDARQPVIDFTNAGIVCLEKGDNRWQATWIITPDVAEIKSQV